MAEREQKIISEARITLNDTSLLTPRWTDKRLFELLNDAQNDMCKSIPMISAKATINTAQGVAEYKLPDESVKLLYASSNGISLNIVAYDEIDRDNPEWEVDKSSNYSSIIVNALSQQVIRPYPLKDDDSQSVAIKVRYQAMPITLGFEEATTEAETNDTEEELTINDMWDLGLKQYVIGMAFLDYGDEASISRSQVALGMYSNEYKRAEKLAKKSFSKRAVTTGYQAKVASSFYGLGGRYGSRSSRFRY